MFMLCVLFMYSIVFCICVISERECSGVRLLFMLNMLLVVSIVVFFGVCLSWCIVFLVFRCG